jgi:LacI family transcriptional regulator
MATIHDVARRAGVSAVTVSRALNASAPVSAAARRRIDAAIEELGFVPNALAQGLKSRSTRTIGLVVTDVTNPFFTSIARGAEDVAHAAGYAVFLCNTDEDMAKQDVYLDRLCAKRVDGLLLVPAGNDVRPLLHWRRVSGPLCLLCRTIPGLDEAEAEIDVVYGESLRAAEVLVAHLAEHGHRRIALVNGPREISTAGERLDGYRRALRRVGLALDPALERCGRFTVDYGRDAAAELLDLAAPPTAIFAASNFLTVGVLATLRDRGLEAPRDVALVGMNDIPQMALIDPRLTVGSQPAAEIGRQAAAFLLERIAHARRAAPPRLPGRRLALETEIIIRSTCGCPTNLELTGSGARRQRPETPRRSLNHGAAVSGPA